MCDSLKSPYREIAISHFCKQMSVAEISQKEGKNPILSYLADSEADIICLQEYNSTKNKKYLTDEDIRKALKAYPYRSIHNPE